MGVEAAEGHRVTGAWITEPGICNGWRATQLEVIQCNGWEWEREMLLPKTCSSAVLPGEPGAGVTGDRRHHSPHQAEARWGGIGTCQLCQSPGEAADNIPEAQTPQESCNLPSRG